MPQCRWAIGCRLLALAAALIGLIPLPAQAQARGFRVHRYDGTAAGSWQLLVDRPWYAPETAVAAGLTFDYSYRPLVQTIRLTPGELTAVVEHAFVGHADLALSLWERLLLSGTVPLTIAERGSADPFASTAPLAGPAVGDPRVGARLRLFGHPERDAFSLHAGVDGWIPVGRPLEHQGETAPQVAPRLILAGAAGGVFTWALEGGAVLRPYSSLGPPALGYVTAPEGQVGIALGAVLANRRLRPTVEALYGVQLLNDGALDRERMRLEVLGSLQLLLGQGLLVSIGAGTSALKTSGTPDARGVFRISWSPRTDADGRGAPPPIALVPGAPTDAGMPAGGADPERSPFALANDAGVPPPTLDAGTKDAGGETSLPDAGAADRAPDVADLPLPPPPSQDADLDGVSDEDDRCPFEPETRNGLRDDDGCPELFSQTAAPLVNLLVSKAVGNASPHGDATDAGVRAAPPATTDAGTVSAPVMHVDSDRDGAPDGEDRCPLTAEDVDGFEDDDGCPEADNDLDGIPDAKDSCALEAETMNGLQDTDGCPDAPADSDRDGVTDDLDRCPFEPETRDGNRDDDGCPEFSSAQAPALTRLLSPPAATDDARSPLSSVDSDGDQVSDDADRCPLQPEDRDGFEEEDGCPETDNDGDHVPDTADRCADVAETQNGYQDEDGCPDERTDVDGDGFAWDDDRCPFEPGTAPDGCPHLPLPKLVVAALQQSPLDPLNSDAADAGDAGTDAVAQPQADFDRDGVVDDEDSCPVTHEDADGFEDEDGCPEPDNDTDGVPDAADRCPFEAETINGLKDTDGCPDPGVGSVTISKDALLIDGVVAFRKGSAKLETSGLKLLAQVALTLKARPAITLEIQGHTDDTGSAAVNIRLSQARADTIRLFLIKAGIAPNRMISRGYGPTRPRAPQNTPEGRELNRRVEFLITGEGR